MTYDRSILETVRWRDGRVRILDQRKLPGEEIYRSLSAPEDVIEAIRTLAVRGAPAIGVAGAFAMALAARNNVQDSVGGFVRALRTSAATIAAARPTAVNLRWACERVLARTEACAVDPPSEMRGVAGRDEVEFLARETLAEAERILEEDLGLSRAMAEHGLQLLPDPGRVISHCNTGGLATGGGGTALGLVLEGARRGRRFYVHVDETRPLLQGSRLTAWELERAGIPYSVQCDGAAAWLMSTRKIDACLVGADRIAANGDAANKIGTLALALAARAFQVPFYVVAPRSSFDLTLATGEPIPIERREESEVLEWGPVRTAPPGAQAWNPAFDVTPANLITAWITERGVEQPPFAG